MTYKMESTRGRKGGFGGWGEIHVECSPYQTTFKGVHWVQIMFLFVSFCGKNAVVRYRENSLVCLPTTAFSNFCIPVKPVN